MVLRVSRMALSLGPHDAIAWSVFSTWRPILQKYLSCARFRVLPRRGREKGNR